MSPRPLQRLRELRARYGLRRGIARELGRLPDRVFGRQTVESLAADIRRLGLESGDTVFVHTALSRIGHVPGGPASVIEAILRVVGPQGTALFPAFSSGGLVVDYIKADPIFDVRSTPSDLGAVPEIFRTKFAQRRSLHPTHSVCGWGRHVQALLEGHEASIEPFGATSPFVKCLEAGGRGLVIGARLHNYTTLRAVEDRRDDYPYPVYVDELAKLRVVDYDGAQSVVTTKVHNPLLGPYRDGDLLIPHLEKRGVVRRGQVGRANAFLVEGGGLLEALDELVEAEIFPFTITPEEFRARHGG